MRAHRVRSFYTWSAVATALLLVAGTAPAQAASRPDRSVAAPPLATQAAIVPAADVEETNPGTAVAYSPNGATMAVGGEDGAVYAYDTGSGALLATLEKQVGAAISAIAFSPNGELLASSGRDSTTVVYKTSDWSQVQQLTGHEQAVTSLAFTPDGSQLVTGGEDTRTLLWKVSDGKLQDALGGATDFITSVAVSPDGATLATGTKDNRIILRNAKTKKRLETLRGHSGKVTSLAFSPDSKTLLSGSADDTAKLWDVAKAKEKRALKGHAGDVAAVAFSKDGKNAASAGDDGSIRVWNPSDGALRKKMGKSGVKIKAIAFSPDGSKIVEAGSDGNTVEYGATDGAVKSSKKLPPKKKRKSGPKSPGKGSAKANPAALASVENASVTPAAAAAPMAIEAAPGGPILVVTNAGDPYSSYYPEILRAEGLNSFATADLAALTAGTLANHDVVLLGAASLSDAQVAMFTTWVNGGGNLVAMRPDAKLASLLGLAAASGTLSNAYLKVDTSSSPGSGIVGETIQFHGAASRYTLSGARAVATLYSNASTATSNPAVTTRSVGSSGGDAAAFTYDLARSIVYTRQGNPAWAGQERDGISPRRSDDMFYGDAAGDSQADWVDLSKVEIPQADEQQRLLVNLINQVNADKKPLPRFWYLPKGLKAAIVMTGDDHANAGTIGRSQQLEAASPADCSIADWECYRGTSYIFPNTPITNAQAQALVTKGHEIGLHLNTSCSDFSASSLAANWDDQLATWQGKYTSLPKPVTNRTHCIAWSDWSTMASESRAEGVRMDTNYYYWPPSWNQDRPGFFTGSGLPMRFTDPSGSMLDIYQAASQMTDESGQSYPYTVDTLLDNALGSKQYFGAFTINAHTDVGEIPESTTTIASAKARNVPIITAKQLLDWTDARNASSFQSLVWAGNKLTFTVDSGARNLTMLVPAQANGQSISKVTRGGADAAYSLRTVKGSSYALVTASAGSYEVTYAPDTTAPSVTETTPAADATGVATTAAVTATFSEPLDPSTVTTSTVELRTSSGTVVPASVTYDAATNVARLAPTAVLASGATYTATVKGGATDPRVRDVAGNALAANRSWSFTTTAGPACPCSIWPSSASPTNPSDNDPNAVELGVKFRSDVSGYITGVKFWKGPQNTGTHTGNLWTSTGTKLASATFSNETGTGWQTVTFSTPVEIAANTTYVASYHTTSGNYAGDNNYFATKGVDAPPLHALQTGVSGNNGLYAYGASQFPNQSWAASNYWVDVVFSTNVGPDTTPPTVTAVTPAADATGVALTSGVTATFSEALDPATVTTDTVKLAGPGGAAVVAQVSYTEATRQVLLQPSAALAGSATYTVTIEGGSGTVVKDVAGNPLAADRTWSFTTVAADTTPPTVTAVTPIADATNVATTVRPTATFSEAMDASTVTSTTVTLTGPGGATVAAQVTYTAATRQVALQPSASLAASTAYTMTIRGGSGSVVKDASGNALATNRTWSFTTAAVTPEPTKYSIWPATATPANQTDPDSVPIELGVKFRSDADGFITGVRFFKGPQNTGTHTGNLWSSTGSRLATALFTGESASGWQEVLFDQPVAITAGTTYVASYHTTSGHYSSDENYFGSSVDNGPLHALSSTTAGGNGTYAYGASSQFPSQSWQASNYWVDVVFVEGTGADTIAPTVTTTSPAQGATGVATGSKVTATFSEAMDASTVTASTVTLTGPSGAVAADVTYVAADRQVTLTPASPLAQSTDYTATIKGGSGAAVKDVAGNALAADRTWSFTTTGPSACDNPANAIVAENCKAGSPASEWEVSGAGDTSIQGYSTDISVNQGGTVKFKIDTTASAYRIDIYRLGFYAGDGARRVATIPASSTTATDQPNCLTQSATGLVDCGNWSESASWSVPADATSGLYLGRAVRTDTGGASHIPFIVRADSSTSDVVFQTSDTTWQAYNEYGGNSLYVGSPAGRAYKVSYNRPFTTRLVDNGQDWIFNSEYPMIRFLERNGYDMSYISGIDTDRSGAGSTGVLRRHKTFLSVGHDEYWSGTQRANVEAARNAGVNLAFFSGNEVFWKTRWENSIDSSATPYRTLVTYKETHANQKIDPNSASTGTWRDPRFGSDGGKPENALTGTIFMVNAGADTALQVPEADGKMRFWRNTPVASLATGATATMPDATLGYEWDADLDNGSRPAGLVRMSTTVSTNNQVLQDHGSTYGNGTVNHALTLYRQPSGGLVFSAGTVQWAWGLDSNHDRGSAAPSPAMQQATVNLLADMDAQPGTRMSGLVVATKSTDTAAPTAAITAPANGATVAANANVTISGTAADTGGGRVGAVEVSTDGTTWHPATGRGTWTYTWRTPASGAVTLRVRASDDSANLQATPTSITVNVGTAAVPAAPSGLTASASTSGISLDWADTSGATGYFVYRAASSGGPWTKLNTTATTTSAWNDTAAPVGTSYYQVTATNAGGESARSSTASAARPTAAPTGLSATPNASGINLDWADTSGASGYFVYRAASSGGPFTKLNATAVTASAYSDTAAPSGTSYYRVTATNAGGESNPSSTVSAAYSPPPAVPTGLTATATTTGITLDWGDVSGAPGYFVYRGTSATGTFTKVNPTATTASAWDDTMAPTGTSFYRVTAVSSAGSESSTSATVSTSMAKANRLSNPSFETVSGSSPASWTSTSRFTRQAASARSGTYGGRHQTTGNPGYTVGQTITGMTAGTAYAFAGWVNIPSTSDSFTFSLQIQWLNSSSTTPLRTDTVATYSAATSGWVKATNTYTAPSGATRAVVNMVTTSFLGPVHVDDFSLR